jgi:hypothetical protein
MSDKNDTEIYTHKCPTHGTERCFQRPPRLWPAWVLKAARVGWILAGAFLLLLGVGVMVGALAVLGTAPAVAVALVILGGIYLFLGRETLREHPGVRKHKCSRWSYEADIGPLVGISVCLWPASEGIRPKWTETLVKGG